MRLRSDIDLLTPLLADPPDVSVLDDKPSWDRIKEHAGRYAVAALVAYAARPHVSPAERVWCDRILVECWVRHERMLRQLEFVWGLLADDGIPSISLKGPLLAQRYYEPPFLRKPSMDLDLAVVEGDLERACRVLMRVGYTPEMRIADALAQSHHLELSHPSRPPVELHFRLSHRALGIPVEEFFDRAVWCRLPGGQEVRILGSADQLLHLVLHLSQSRFGTLFHLYEIRRVCSTEPPAVLAEAVQRAADHHYCGALRMMDIAFRSRWNQPFLPPGVTVPKTWLNWRLTPKLYRAFENWSLPGRGLSLPERLWARWLDFQLTDRPADAMRLAAFFFGTAWFYIGDGEAWGTPRHIHFTAGGPGPVEMRDDSSPPPQ
jgi:hypothetical protein